MVERSYIKRETRGLTSSSQLVPSAHGAHKTLCYDRAIVILYALSLVFVTCASLRGNSCRYLHTCTTPALLAHSAHTHVNRNKPRN